MKAGAEWRRVRRAAFALAAAALAAAAIRSVRLAAAEEFFLTGRPGGIRQAVRLEPARSLYRLAAADLAGLAGRDPRQELRAAVERNPYDAALRIRLGLEAEARGDFREAEAQLLEAARRNRKYLPRWTLAGYYFRRNDNERFWEWARAALAIAPESPDPLFDLCWRADPARAAEIAQGVAERPGVALAFAEFLARRGEWARAAALAPRLAERAEKRQEQRLLGLVSGFASHGRIPAAVAIWNGLCRRGWLPWAEKGPGSTQWLTNPDFTRLPSGRGFDWRWNEASGVSWRPAPGGGLRAELSGRQPERTWLVRQSVPALRPGPVRLACSYEIRGPETTAGGVSTGLRWRIWAAGSPARLLGESPPLISGSSGRTAVSVRVPADTNLLRVELIHERQPGTQRFRGRVLLRRVTLELQEAFEKP